MKLFLATANGHKVEEFSRLFAEAGVNVEVHSARAAGGMPPVEETEKTFLGNARLKAEALRARVSPEDWILADDSGLEVMVLRGEPGVLSARYAGADATDARNRSKLLRRLEGMGAAQRAARFVCVLVLLGPDGLDKVFEGECRGCIVTGERGSGGFGYDRIFVPDSMEQTFAEVDPAVKDRLSHRGAALRQLVSWVKAAGV